jgi:hypothetical protein
MSKTDSPITAQRYPASASVQQVQRILTMACIINAPHAEKFICNALNLYISLRDRKVKDG